MYYNISDRKTDKTVLIVSMETLKDCDTYQRSIQEYICYKQSFIVLSIWFI